MMRAAFATAVAALSIAGCGDDAVPTATPDASVTAQATVAATTTAVATPAGLDQAIWPPEKFRSTDPLEVARSFVADYIGLEGNPQLGEFSDTEPRVGEVDVFARGEDGSRRDNVVSTLSLRQLDGEYWYVTSAQSEEVELTLPEPLAVVASPVKIEGRGRGFEGNVVLEVRAGFEPEPLAAEPVTAGSAEKLEPFSLELAFKAPAAATGSILAKTGSGISVANGFAAIPVRF